MFIEPAKKRTNRQRRSVRDIVRTSSETLEKEKGELEVGRKTDLGCEQKKGGEESGLARRDRLETSCPQLAEKLGRKEGGSGSYNLNRTGPFVIEQQKRGIEGVQGGPFCENWTKKATKGEGVAKKKDSEEIEI